MAEPGIARRKKIHGELEKNEEEMNRGLAL
jgi:hypothetical protein